MELFQYNSFYYFVHIFWHVCLIKKIYKTHIIILWPSVATRLFENLASCNFKVRCNNFILVEVNRKQYIRWFVNTNKVVLWHLCFAFFIQNNVRGLQLTIVYEEIFFVNFKLLKIFFPYVWITYALKYCFRAIKRFLSSTSTFFLCVTSPSNTTNYKSFKNTQKQLVCIS